MAAAANPERSDEERYTEIADRLVAIVDDVVPAWIERLVIERIRTWSGDVSPEIEASAVAAGESARDQVVPALRELVHADIDEQRGNPLSLLRAAARHAHTVLDDAGMPPMPRDQFSRASFPDDVYDLVPASWRDVDPALHEIGISWGAAKAFVFKARRRAEGRR